MKSQYRTLLYSFTLSTLAAAATAQPLTLTPSASVQIPGSPGKFDFLRIDTKRHRLLAAHEKDGTSDIVDLDKNTLISRVKVGAAVDTAVDADAKFYYVSVQEGERIAVVDAATLKEVKSIKMGGPTDAMVLEPKSHKIYITHDDGTNVWVVDTSTDKVVGSITIPGVPEFMVYDESTGRLYLNIKTKDVVAVIDPASSAVVAQWPTGAAKQPHGLALDAASHRIFVAGGNGKAVQIDTKTGAVTGTADITPQVDQIAFDAANSLLYCAGTDKMTVLRTTGGKLTSLGDATTAATAKNVAVDPATGAVWTTFTDGKNSFAKAWLPPKQ